MGIRLPFDLHNFYQWLIAPPGVSVFFSQRRAGETHTAEHLAVTAIGIVRNGQGI